MKSNYMSIGEITSIDSCYMPYQMVDKLDVSDFNFLSNPLLNDKLENEQFIKALFSSLELDLTLKKRVVNEFSELDIEQITKILDVLNKERSEILNSFNSLTQYERKEIKEKEISACRDYLAIALEHYRKVLPSSKFYRLHSFNHIESIWSFAVSGDGLTALVGVGEDKAGLIQFAVDKGTIVGNYRLPGKYVMCMGFITNTRVVVGTSNGYVAIIDLKNTLVIKNAAIESAGNSIRSLIYTEVDERIYVATTNKMLALSSISFDVLFEQKINFSPWDILAIPNSKLVVISGGRNKIALYACGASSFKFIDSVSCGPEKRDVSSIIFSDCNNLLISASESGFLDFWNVTHQGFHLERHVEVDDRIYSLCSEDNFVTFSGNNGGIYLYNIEKNTLANIFEGRKGSKPVLSKVKGKIFLMAQLSTDNEVIVADLTNNDWNFLRYQDLSNLDNLMAVTVNGDIILMSSDGITSSNLFDARKELTLSTEKTCIPLAQKILFNQHCDSLLVQAKDCSYHVLNLTDNHINRLNLPNGNGNLAISDFMNELVLLRSSNKITVIDISNDNAVSTIDCNFEYPISDARILDAEHLTVLSIPNPSAGKEALVKVYDLLGDLKSIMPLGFTHSTYFNDHNKLIRSISPESASITDMLTGETIIFDINYAFEKDDVAISQNGVICAHLSYDEMICVEITSGKKRWKIQDPILKSFSIVGFLPQFDGLILINKEKGELISVSCTSGEIVGRQQLDTYIIYINLSVDGRYVAWITARGDWQTEAVSFGTDIARNSSKPWRKLWENKTIDAKLYLDSVSVADLWLVVQRRFNNLEFCSMQSSNHQLDPCGFKLHIPNIEALDYYNPHRTISALLSKVVDSPDTVAQKDISIIYHELFHVFQANSTRAVFDYFSLVDRLQTERVKLLYFLGKIDFFNAIDSIASENCLTIFHCANQCQNKDLKYLSNLNNQDIKDLLEYFSISKDVEIQTLEIIEGSAEVFGLCCGGYSAFCRLDQQIREREKNGDRHINAEMYTKAYQLFKQYGGRTPILLITLSLLSLKFGSLGEVSSATPPDIFMWGLRYVPLWEDELDGILTDEIPDVEQFSSIMFQMIKKVSSAIQGQFHIAVDTSIHESGNDIKESPFLTALTEIRTNLYRGDEFIFLNDLILQKDTAYHLIDNFKIRSESVTETDRLFRLLQDFEQLLLHKASGCFNIYCCSAHGDVSTNDAWHKCDHPDSFKTLLSAKFDITLPGFMFD